MVKLLHVLVIEDSENDAELLLEEIREAGYDPISERVQTAESLTAALVRHTWDVILSDYVMPQFSAPDALKVVRAKHPEIPFIVISGVVGEEAAVSMMKAGASDYLVKTKLSRLVPAIEREMETAYTHRARAQAEASAKFLAAIVESSDDAIYGVKLDGTVVSWNRAAERTFGFRAGEIIGRNVSILFPDERLDELIDTMERIKRGDHVGRSETARVRKGGRLVPLSVTVSPMKNGDGKISGASVIARDITNRKREEQERIKLIQELTDALSRAKTLAGLLPICANCKRIRDDQGYWQQVEAYISRHSDVIFSHGTCPDCVKAAENGHEHSVASGTHIVE
ncbi:MAG TPA: PAS domain S-box protein [Verrucomicrobiae bacterium]|jgi:PAS domain S-box-containing protein|nr:PAS domain S-box protein [Verrucomicrobiae bacterium]